MEELQIYTEGSNLQLKEQRGDSDTCLRDWPSGPKVSGGAGRGGGCGVIISSSLLGSACFGWKARSAIGDILSCCCSISDVDSFSVS